MKTSRQVTKDEFDAALKAYPAGKLQQHVVRICDPHLICYLDWSLPSVHAQGTGERWDDCIVASISADWIGPNGELDKEDHRRFWKFFLHTRSDAPQQ